MFAKVATLSAREVVDVRDRGMGSDVLICKESKPL